MLHSTQSSNAILGLSRQEAVLVGITMLWGATFLVGHLAMRHSGPFFFVGLRFLVAGALSWLVFLKVMRDIGSRELLGGGAIGVLLSLGYSLQTVGLQTSSSSQVAFITALYVPMVPLLQMVFLRRMPRAMSWIGTALAFAGLILMAGPAAGSIQFTPGEVASLLGALAMAGEIILISRFATNVDPRRITVIQLLAASACSFLMMPLAGEGVPTFSWMWIAPALGLGLASTIIQIGMNWAQRTVSATRATVIYAGEPVWGGMIGRLAGERLPALAILGGLFIVAGVIVSELRLPRRRSARPQPPFSDAA